MLHLCKPWQQPKIVQQKLKGEKIETIFDQLCRKRKNSREHGGAHHMKEYHASETLILVQPTEI